ncbi:hypothetical protein SapgrDRAFT_0027, partial [Saprospira grandis DSM 2844]
DMGRWFQPSARFIGLSLVSFVAVGFNLQAHIIQDPRALALGVL